MKMYVICDNNDTLTGLRLAGVEGEKANTKEAFEEAARRILKDKSIGILMITEGYGKKYPELVNELKMNNEPLVIEIPDRHGTGRKPNFIMAYINEAIGVKL